MNNRKTCPRCKSPIPMSFIFPSPQPNPKVEAEIGRLQECTRCCWRGDAQRGMEIIIWRDYKTYYFNLKPFKSLYKAMLALGMIEGSEEDVE